MARPFTSMDLEMEEVDENDQKQKVTKAGMADGIRCDEDGNIWSSAGWVGAHGYDGVHVFEPKDGKRIGQILLAGNLQQCQRHTRLLRRHQTQPTIHDCQPIALRGLRRNHGRTHFVAALMPREFAQKRGEGHLASLFFR